MNSHALSSCSPCFCAPIGLPILRLRPIRSLTIARRPALRRAPVLLACASAGDDVARILLELDNELRAHLAAEKADPDEAATTLSYPALAAAGRTDLIERIIDAGGYSALLTRLGIPLPYSEPEAPPLPRRVFDVPENEGRLALGATLDERLSAPLPPGTAPSSRMRKVRVVEDQVPSAEDLLRQPQGHPPGISHPPPPPGELLTLGGGMRGGLLVLVTLTALGFGHASEGLLDANVVQVCKIAAKTQAVTHVALAFYAALEARTRMRRSAGLWFFKVLLSGPAGLVALQRFGVLKETSE